MEISKQKCCGWINLRPRRRTSKSNEIPHPQRASGVPHKRWDRSQPWWKKVVEVYGNNPMICIDCLRLLVAASIQMSTRPLFITDGVSLIFGLENTNKTQAIFLTVRSHAVSGLSCLSEFHLQDLFVRGFWARYKLCIFYLPPNFDGTSPASCTLHVFAATSFTFLARSSRKRWWTWSSARCILGKAKQMYNFKCKCCHKVLQ